jgi:hypothetical protein
MYGTHKVTFVEELPDMDELENASHKRIIENYEHSSPPPPSGKKGSGPYTLYENIYGGERKAPPSSMGNFTDESISKDLLLNKAMQKLPTRLDGGTIAMPPPRGEGQRLPPHISQSQQIIQEQEQQPKFFVPEYHHNQSYIIYENTKIPTYSSTMTPQPPLRPPPQRRTPHLLQRRTPPPQRRQTPQPQSQSHQSHHSLCSMINEHISTCSLCNNLYITTIKSKCKTQPRSMSTVFFVIIIIILIIVCFILMKKLWNQSANLSV